MPDKNIVNHKNLKEVLEKLGTEANNKFARKDRNNTFTAKNTFPTVHLGGNESSQTLTVFEPRNPIAELGSKWGVRTFSSHNSNPSGYVKSLQIGVAGTQQQGTNVQVSIWEVKKGGTKAEDEPTLIADKVQLTVLDKASWFGTHSRYIEYPINKHYNNETYFIYSFVQANIGNRVTSNTFTQNNEHIF